MLDCMLGSTTPPPPSIHSVLKSFMNEILSSYYSYQIFKVCHILKEFISYRYMILSSSLAMQHEDITALNLLCVYF
jgi:hypothetical protein